MRASGNDYADWINERVKPNLFLVLNMAHPKQVRTYDRTTRKVEKTKEELQKDLISLFHNLECQHFGYKQRHQYPKYKRIERGVCIEKKDYWHANIYLKSYGNYTDTELLLKIKKEWLKIQNRKNYKEDNFLMIVRDNSLLEDINKVRATRYGNKDTEKQNKQLEDVLCMRASFICKHSNRL